MKRNLLNEFEGYMEKIGLANVSAIQKQETRRAFFAGAHLMLEKMKELGDSDISENEGLKAIQDYTNQLESFLEKIGTDY